MKAAQDDGSCDYPEPPKPPPPECEPWLSKHQKGQFFDCNDNGRARDAGNDQPCIDSVLGKPDPFDDGRRVQIVRNWGADGHCVAVKPKPENHEYSCENRAKTKSWGQETTIKFTVTGAGGADGGDRGHHGNPNGGSGQTLTGTIKVPANTAVTMYVGCKGHTSGGRKGGGGGGSSAILVGGREMVVAGAGGGSAAVANGVGGNAGFPSGSQGGRDVCGRSSGAKGGTASSGGKGGGGNRGKPSGARGGKRNGGNAGGSGGGSGGWGYGRGGNGANNPGDGGGGGGGGGYYGGGGGGTGCHGNGGGGGSSYFGSGVTWKVNSNANNRNKNGRIVIEVKFV